MNFKISDIASVRTGIVTARKKAKLNSKEKINYKQISLKCFTNNINIDKSNLDIFTSFEKIDSKYFTQEGDVLVRLRAPSLAVYIKKEDEGLLIHSLLAVIRAKSNKVDMKYLAYYINSNFAQRILKQVIKGTAIPMLKTKDLEELCISLPTLKRQKEIVKFLDLANKERELLLSLAYEKKQLTDAIFDTIIKQKEEN